jgi:hypothetical protein
MHAACVYVVLVCAAERLVRRSTRLVSFVAFFFFFCPSVLLTHRRYTMYVERSHTTLADASA